MKCVTNFAMLIKCITKKEVSSLPVRLIVAVSLESVGFL